MGNSFEEIERNKLADMIRRRNILNRAIADLAYELEHPRPPIKIDFEAVKREVEGPEGKYCSLSLEKRHRKDELLGKAGGFQLTVEEREELDGLFLEWKNLIEAKEKK